VLQRIELPFYVTGQFDRIFMALAFWKANRLPLSAVARFQKTKHGIAGPSFIKSQSHGHSMGS
jgi:hypothetical protein